MLCPYSRDQTSSLLVPFLLLDSQIRGICLQIFHFMKNNLNRTSGTSRILLVERMDLLGTNSALQKARRLPHGNSELRRKILWVESLRPDDRRTVDGESFGNCWSCREYPFDP